MSYNILTETDFFKVVENTEDNPETGKMQEAYHKLVTMVIDLCHQASESKDALHVLVFAETELQFHPSLHSGELSVLSLYVKKALAFIRKMMQQVKSGAAHVVSTSPSASVNVEVKKEASNIPSINWTGNAVDLVEMVYGICVMGSVNDGDVKFKDLAQAMYQFFGVKSKDCYRFYTDIRRRKNHSRTYFLDKMQEKLNDKMRRDDELERMRR